MLLKELINKSVYGTTGYISSLDSLEQLEQYILFNLPVLKEFKQIIVATNYKSDDWHHHQKQRKVNFELWRKYFPDCVVIDLKTNRGHNFGTTDLDDALFNYCKENNIEWLCKSAHDIIMKESILEKEIDKADFYYFNGVGYGGMVPFNFDYEKIINEAFFPQTNFYFINVSKTDFINDKEYINETYEYSLTIPNYNGRIWEYIDGWACEHFLAKSVERNNLTKYHLLSNQKYITLLDCIKHYNIHDCSHKNIFLDGVCHFHFPNSKIIEI
jgi:hypothetical protein